VAGIFWNKIIMDKRKIRPVGVGKGYKLSDEVRNQIYEMYFNGPYGMRSIAHKLELNKSTVRRHVKQMREEQLESGTV
tara:strand:+ start:364 stop:597 length:234 start_codon:yes stop_codon:yes gene_type:complete